MGRLSRALVGAVMTAGLVVGLAAPALAHVTVNPNTATQGGYAKLAFRVPNEKDAADTTQVDVQLPLDHPIASVSVQPQPGWTYKVTKSKLPTPIKTDDGEVTDAVSQITWTGGTIKPGEFTEFNISAGPLPKDVTSLTFKALQTYSDGDVVRWIEDAKPGQPTPQHPAPVLTLNAAGATGTATTPAATTAATTSSKSSDGTARALGIVGIVVGALGLAAAALSFSGRRGGGGAQPTNPSQPKAPSESLAR